MNHPILVAASDIRSLLKGVAGTNPTFMSTSEKAAALRELVAAEAQLVELRLRVLADAGDLADATGAKDAAGWLAHQTRARYADARADLALAGALDRERPVLAVGMREGAVTLAQAHVIRRALDALPVAVDADTVDRAEAHLVACAAEFGPKELGRIGRRVLDVVAPEIAEAAEAARLADLEARAADKTRMTMRRQGDGTTRISALVPDAVATRLATYLEAFANPRAPHEKTGGDGDPFTRLPYPRRMGEAFARFLEAADPTRLPVHGGDATTVVVTIPLASLRAELATADLIGAGLVPGDDLTGDRITASQARRLACTAKILPTVLDGTSLPVDLGRAKRLFTPAQRKALLIRDRTCRAEGCDTPGTWCDAHHLDPWHTGGPTDLDNAILLCPHHHHRAHDTGYRTDRLPNGDLRFHRRT
ncbi:HNH endonuclease [Nocardioides sp. S5]|uniref:HNH endonuclease signature motif containing protein n=1 Tax=Nocardioides sp. S5 TaxID=2017486 RepID=UPI001A8DA92C|nr:HNH endonuclease signature motif containing protein [Nocardioides sp. S5]QSR31999.1 HNH endonuclease [Nocardioides sp. S5]